VPKQYKETITDDTLSDPSSGFVSFGKYIQINPSSRLQRFDNGESKAFAAFDSRDKNKKYIALVSGVECLPRYASTTIYNNLADTSFMRLIGAGIVSWHAEKRQKYVFLYDGAIGDVLLPKDGFNALHWRHPDINEYLIQPVARVLKEMSDKGFHHGSIRVDNIFHSAADRKGPVIVGDCLSIPANSSQPSVYLPINKAMSNPLGRGAGSVSDDIYAFGVTMVMALRKGNELSTLSDEEILSRKIEMGSYATIIGKERFQTSFLEFLRGVLHDDPALRWGMDDIFSWLDGSRITPAPSPKRKKANRPLSFHGKKYLYADLLALDIHKNSTEIKAMVDDGRLTQWIDKSISDTNLTERYMKLLERLAGNGDNEFFLSALRMVLNPDLPILHRGEIFSYDGIGPMMARASCEGDNLSFYKNVISSNLLDMAAAHKNLHQNDLIKILKTLDACRASLKLSHKINYGTERCVYMLCKDAPCLSPKFKNSFVNGYKSALLTYEKLCGGGKEVAIILDKHAVSFFSVLTPSAVDKVLYDLSSDDKDQKILGNLRFLAFMQKNSENIPCPAIASVFSGSLSGLCKVFKNNALQKRIQGGLQKAAQEGNLTAMASFFEDEQLKARDNLGFKRAAAEYNMLQKEYDEYNKRLANKKAYGLSNGQDIAAIISWSISTIITMVVVLSHISGYSIF